MAMTSIQNTHSRSLASLSHSSPSRIDANDPKRPLEHDDFPSNRHRALSYCWSMIFPENRYPLFGIMLKCSASVTERNVVARTSDVLTMIVSQDSMLSARH